MRMSEYKNKYREFMGYLHDFRDPADDSVSDEDIGRRLRSGWPQADRIDMLEKLVPEAGRMLEGMDAEWHAFAETVNRHFDGPTDAKDWLSGIRAAWQDELARLKRG